jgi:HEPN domain-containing protein
MNRATRQWVKKAEDDFGLAETTAAGPIPLHDQVAFHCQQAAEKYLKAVLNEGGLAIPKTHDLEALLDLLLPAYPVLRSHRRGLAALTNFAVAVRYPGKNANRRQAVSCLRWAARARATCREFLGLPPP